MSDTNTEDKKIESAKNAYQDFLKQFETEHGYGVGAISTITTDGRIETVMKLVKLNNPAPAGEPLVPDEEDEEEAENPVSTPQNDEAKAESGTTDSGESNTETA